MHCIDEPSRSALVVFAGQGHWEEGIGKGGWHRREQSIRPFPTSSINGAFATVTSRFRNVTRHVCLKFQWI